MDLFDQYFKAMDSLPKSPYFNTFFTGSSHPPYYIPNEEQYVKRLDHEISQENKAFINAYGTYMKTIMFVDEALQDFFEEYKQRKDYENTLFIITGDHPMSELPRINELTKYHVPLIIYSPKLKKTHKFNHSVSHLDFSNTMLNYLKNYNLNLPKNSASLGFNLFNTDKSTTRRYAFMDGNRGMYEYYADGYYLRKNQLFKVNADLSIQEINNDSLKNDLQKALDNFKTINYRTSFDNKVLSKEEYTQGLNKEILYKKLVSSFIKSKDEYINMVPSSLIENKDFRVELNFDFIKNIDNGLMVFEMKDAADSIVFWQSTSLKEAKEYQVHYHFEKNKKLGSELFFSIYLWNQEKEEIELKNMDILIQ